MMNFLSATFLNTVFVYCWGTNEVRGYLFDNPILPPWITCDLGPDPLPADLQEGRATLFSSELSKHRRFSCLTCHVDGQSDFVPWPISGPNDDKGPGTRVQVRKSTRNGSMCICRRSDH